MFSPHTRGCSHYPPYGPSNTQVFPAYAGMFRGHGSHRPSPGGFPRIRGDVPSLIEALLPIIPFSPHTRGCSGRRNQTQRRHKVFPAYAGMFPPQLPHRTHTDCFPRIRGDVPLRGRSLRHGATFSPHTRGCSLWCGGNPCIWGVFPAYAGMFLPLWVLQHM